MKKSIWLATVRIALAWAYCLIIFLLDEIVGGVRIRLAYLVPTFVIGVYGIYWIVRWSVRWQWVSMTRLQNISLTTIVSLLCVVIVDIGFSVYLNAFTLGSSKDENRDYYRLTDRYVWAGELFPRPFYPTQNDFQIYKPGVTISGVIISDFTSPQFMDYPTVAKSVFQVKHVSFSIDQHGFRETTKLESADLFALGDSFTMGASVDQDKTWVKLLEKTIQNPIYNLGVAPASPKQELMILEYMLQTKGDAFKIRHLLWLIYEGNDLEGNDVTLRSIQIREHGLLDLFKGTIIETLIWIPHAIKQQAVVTKFRNHQVVARKFRKGHKTIAGKSKESDEADPYLVDGVRLPYPLYYSPLHGYRFFFPDYVERATHSKSAVIDHPGRPHLDQVFKDMALLARRFHFKVTVLIAPDSSRLYGPYFANFPPISNEPHFVNYVVDMSRQLDFDTINLFELLQPYAKKELLYFRDDIHWNERGNEVVAEIIARHLFQKRGEQSVPLDD